MEYFLKASAITVIFYICYILFLQRETFFVSNRWFLILGLVTAVLFPLMTIPIYVEGAAPTHSDGFTMIATTTQNAPETFDVSTLLIWIYGIGASLFLARLIIQFFSLVAIIKPKDKKKISDFTYVETTQNIAPFSFFRWIVYNPIQFNAQELQLILQHEKVHAKQMHSMDVIFVDLITALFWFNPFIWLYRKALKQNLEFIADHNTQKQTGCEERYQKLLLKTSVPQKNLMLINTFYNSTIRLKMFGKQITLFTSFGQVKKRILMLHKSKSNLMNSWKYTIIVPLLVIFAMTFNTEIIAQTSDNVSETSAKDQQNILKFVVTKDTKDKQLDFIKDKLAEKGALISFNKVNRNSKNEITTIKIKYEYKGHKGNHSIKASTPISPMEISLNPSDDTINVGQQVSALSQTFDLETTEEGQTALKKSTGTKNDRSNSESTSEEENSYQIKKENNVIKDSIFIENASGKVRSINSEDEDVHLKFIKKGNHKTKLFKNDGNSPLVIFDGKEINKDEMEAMSPNTIGSIQVLKDKAATITYGEKGENGVILITSKNGGFFKTKDGEIISIVEEDDQKPGRISISKNEKTPLYIVDGEEISKIQMEAINPNTIDSIEVLKDESATKKYGKKGKNGVIIITLKKE